MGFLIFAFRKLTLRQELNRKQFRLMSLGIELQRTQNQASMLQQATSMTQDAWGMVYGSLSSASNSLFQMTQGASQVQINNAREEYQKAIDNAKGDTSAKSVVDARRNYEMAFDKSKNEQAAAAGIFTASQGANMLVNHAVTSVFDAASDYQLKMLHMKEQRITSEKNSLESQVKTMEAELQGVEKAEDQAAKDSAPKFGLS